LVLEHKAAGAVMTDHWKAYAEFIPKAQHIQSKAETFTIAHGKVEQTTFYTKLAMPRIF
jgi:IS1 family transposase